MVACSVGTSGIVAVLGVQGSGCGSDGGEHPVKGSGGEGGERYEG